MSKGWAEAKWSYTGGWTTCHIIVVVCPTWGLVPHLSFPLYHPLTLSVSAHD